MLHRTVFENILSAIGSKSSPNLETPPNLREFLATYPSKKSEIAPKEKTKRAKILCPRDNKTKKTGDSITLDRLIKLGTGDTMIYLSYYL